MGPYRTIPTESSTGPSTVDARADDRTLGLVLLVLGLARVVMGLAEHEVFGAEATMALLMVGLAVALLVPRRRSR